MKSEKYLALLKGKRGEFRAIKALDPLDNLSLLIEVPPVECDLETGEPKKATADHVSGYAGKIAAAWQVDRPIYVDTDQVDDESTGATSLIFEEARDLGLAVIPVASTESTGRQLGAVREVLQKDSRGVCIRIHVKTPDELLTLGDAFVNVMGAIEVEPLDCDLVVDLGHFPHGVLEILKFAVRHQIDFITGYGSWRSITLVGCGMPEVIPISSNEHGSVRRLAWDLWNDVAPVANSDIGFADYGITNPEYLSFDPRKMTPAARIIYTSSNVWRIFKGRSLKKHGRGPQYRILCQAIVEHDDYCGADFSWGDQYIYDCANGDGTSGSPEMMVSVGTNHHLTFVQHQLASSSVSLAVS